MDWFNVATTLALGALFGGMLMFSAVFAPLVFTKLPMEHAGPFIRAVFPWYYLYIVVLGLLGTVLAALAGANIWVLLPTAVVGLAGVYTRQVLMPQINALRDRELAGDKTAAAPFNAKHRLSVAINAVQLLVAGAVLAYWAYPGNVPPVPGFVG
ncbi:DUF4149 domain-containing protein [Limnobacter sp.]|uniref:DUF4149 domain-containing protein n=1 Tax=Limnobacter sp. TaxID=2003368 RepID=UPI003518D94D